MQIISDWWMPEDEKKEINPCFTGEKQCKFSQFLNGAMTWVDASGDFSMIQIKS